MVVLDTSIVIDLLKGRAKAAEIIRPYEGKEKIAITVLSRYELLRCAKKPDRFKILGFLDSVKVYSLGELEFDRAVDIFKELSSRGNIINEFDILIAAIALANNETLLSFDKDFKGIKNDKIRVVG